MPVEPIRKLRTLYKELLMISVIVSNIIGRIVRISSSKPTKRNISSVMLVLYLDLEIFVHPRNLIKSWCDVHCVRLVIGKKKILILAKTWFVRKFQLYFMLYKQYIIFMYYFILHLASVTILRHAAPASVGLVFTICLCNKLSLYTSLNPQVLTQYLIIYSIVRVFLQVRSRCSSIVSYLQLWIRGLAESSNWQMLSARHINFH